MRLYLFLIFLFITISCQPKTSDWKILDFGAFNLKAPSGWIEIEAKSFDSYVGGLTNGKDTLSFDYGWYSADIGDEDPQKHKFGQDTINGLIASLVIPITPGEGFIKMYIRVNSEDKFSISGLNIKGTDTVLQIFKSIVFKESDTTINGVLNMSKFKEYPNGTGKTLVNEKCVRCHSIKRNVEGPDLKYLMEERTSEWLLKFFTNRRSVSNDSIHLNLKEVFNNRECMTFPEITIEEIELIREYIINK